MAQPSAAVLPASRLGELTSPARTVSLYLCIYCSLYFVEDGQPIQLFSNGTAGWSTTGLVVDSTRRLVYVAAHNATLSNVASIISLSKVR